MTCSPAWVAWTGACRRFIRITGSLLPDKVFLRYVPELLNGSRTLAGVPVRAQLLGQTRCMAENAARLAACSLKALT